MIGPAILAWMKQRDYLARQRISRFAASLFERITPETTPAEIVGRIRTAVSFGKDVVHRESLPGAFFAGAAILTTMVGTTSHKDPESQWNPTHFNRSIA